MPCDCGPPPTPEEIAQWEQMKANAEKIMEGNYRLWQQEIPKLQAKAGIDITSFIIPEETKEYKRNED